MTSAGGTTSVSLDDHIRIGSVTKTWTGTVILQLVQEGKLKLEDPVSKYRSDVPNDDNITIEQLVTMRGGIYNYSESYELSKALDTLDMGGRAGRLHGGRPYDLGRSPH